MDQVVFHSQEIVYKVEGEEERERGKKRKMKKEKKKRKRKENKKKTKGKKKKKRKKNAKVSTILKNHSFQFDINYGTYKNTRILQMSYEKRSK